MEERQITVATGLTLAALEAGNGGRPFLLVHGFTGAKEDFAEHLDRLAAEGWHVVAPDLRGHGRSEQPEGLESYSLDAMAGDVLALADALGWDRLTLLGHSMGGMVVQHVALRAPERLVALVLMDTSHGPVGGIDPESIELGKAVVSEGGMALLVEAQRGRPGELQTPADLRLRETRPGYVEFGEAKARACAADMWLGMIDEIVSTQPDRLAELSDLDLPVLIVVGEQDRPFLGAAHAMAEAIPGAMLQMISDAGHSPQFENPEEWFGALSGFLSSSHATWR